MYQHHPKGCGFESPPSLDADIVPLTHVVDVDRDAGISADAMFLHQGDQLSFCQVVWWGGLPLGELRLEGKYI